MIPRDWIAEWRNQAPWSEDFQIEQDLVISRALVEIFSHPVLADGLAFRGGTALYKLYLKPPSRYSEDIDLVRTTPGPAGPMMSALREVLDPWLGKPKWKQTERSITFLYRFESQDTPPLRMTLKIEINPREHFSVFGYSKIPFSVNSSWFDGTSDIITYSLEELLGTKLRALYQRKKGRDLFDLALALDSTSIDPDRVIVAFDEYTKRGGYHITRALFERNMVDKLRDPRFNADMGNLLAPGCHWDIKKSAANVSARLIARLPGEPWTGE
ncbi:MAG: nucleotidyl transferase AbiEii/AbiGii toxin family protein [Candidatus Dadabacteria bacterium]|nr:nucleotidyl transferase AbiEii/AbiGii toxin family protein [Candidatus Dadabacteria bacterium]